MIEAQTTNLLHDSIPFDADRKGTPYRFTSWQDFTLDELQYPSFWRRLFNKPLVVKHPYVIRTSFDVFITGAGHKFLRTGYTTTEKVDIIVSPLTPLDPEPGAIVTY